MLHLELSPKQETEIKKMDDLYKDLGKQIKEARKKRGYSMADVAEKLGCTSTYINQVEAGNSVLSIKQLVRFCETLDVKLSIKIK